MRTRRPCTPRQVISWFVRETTLFAQPFDLDRLDVSGPAIPLAESIAQNRGVSLATLSASPTGTVAYGVSAEQYWQFAWFDRSGRRLASAGPNSAGGHPSLRPDGKAIALNRVLGGMWDIWISGSSSAVACSRV